MLDKPDARELLEAVASFLTEEALPALHGGVRFHALVAANVVRIALRELDLGPALLERECAELSGLLGKQASPDHPAGAALACQLNAELCARIEAGEADTVPFRRRVLDYLKDSVSAKLAIDNPKVRCRPSTKRGISSAPG